MLQEEFEKLTGIKVDEDFFNTVINPMYMNTKMDKQQFCEEYKKHGLGKSSVAIELTNYGCSLYKKVNKMTEERRQLVDFLIDMDEPKCDAKAIKMVGHKEVIRIKLEKGYDLSEEDKYFLINLCTEI